MACRSRACAIHALTAITNTHYRGFDLDYPDVERAKVFLSDLKQFEASGNMPRFDDPAAGQRSHLGNRGGQVAPLSSFADNDYALGMMVEGVSKSRFWAKTAIFVIEDDAQNGPDHVDSHRSPMFALSPYTRRGMIDSSMYNQSSVLRTMELILGLRPLTHFDAGARPLAVAFASAPNTAPYRGGEAADFADREKSGGIGNGSVVGEDGFQRRRPGG